MTQATHTPGPWEISQWTPTYDDIGGDYSVGYRDTDGIYWDIATLEPSRASRLADAHLIAAAPELLAVLVRFASAVEVAEALGEIPEGLFPESMADALAAIAKAKGE